MWVHIVRIRNFITTAQAIQTALCPMVDAVAVAETKMNGQQLFSGCSVAAVPQFVAAGDAQNSFRIEIAVQRAIS